MMIIWVGLLMSGGGRMDRWIVVVVVFVVAKEFCSQNSVPAVQSPVCSARIVVKVLDKAKNKTIPDMPNKCFIILHLGQKPLSQSTSPD